MRFNKEQFQDFMIDNQVIKVSEKPFTLKSGAQSHLYINWRTVSEDVYSLDLMSDFLLDYLMTENLNVECIFGVPEGATKLALLATYKRAKLSMNYDKGSHMMAMGRGKAKEHGSPKDAYFLGAPIGRDVVVIEDVTTTGGSLKKCVEMMKKAGVNVVAAITLTNRHENPEELMAEFKNLCPLYAMTDLSELIERFIKTHENPNWVRGILAEGVLQKKAA